MTYDIWGQEIHNGDFVVSASKSSGEMVMGVMKEVDKQTRIRIDKNWNTKVWRAARSATRMYTMSRTLKLSDEFIAATNPQLFDVMNDVRDSLQLPTNRKLSTDIHDAEALRKVLANALR